MDALAELARLLRPAGGGILTVSSGGAEKARRQAALYGTTDAAAIAEDWRRALAAALDDARVAILGIPSDAGAGLRRGAAAGPLALREALRARHPSLAAGLATRGVMDVGDVAVIPQLLHDEMLNDAQLAAARAALYPDAPAGARLPVSPLSIAERALDLLLAGNPALKVLILGGDHSVAWPAVAALHRHRDAFAIVQPDAHTDLLADRFGVKYCFATWAFHANDLIARAGRLVQVGVRASTRPREHWEKTLGVKQLWADDVRRRGMPTVAAEIVAHLRGIGATRVYFSNDIDGTDPSPAPATGAPEPGGLAPADVVRLLDELGRAFEIVGADLTEVAPILGSPEEIDRTLAVGADYLAASLRALLAGPASA